MAEGVAPDVDWWRQLFFPDHTKRLTELKEGNVRLAHYTGAEVAANILRGRTIWMRNALLMNDYSEIEHGLACLNAAWKDQERGNGLKKLLNEIYEGLAIDLQNSVNRFLPGLHTTTYMTCLSEHTSAQDSYGRLSMWRAYGGKTGVALILNNDPFVAEATPNGPYSTPVLYLNSDDFGKKFSDLTERLATNRISLKQIPKEHLLLNLTWLFRFAILCTKHPGFEEEREWRVLYSPERSCAAIKNSFEVVNTIPQTVYKLPLIHDPPSGLNKADIPSLLNRLLIGPTSHPLVLQQTFASILSEAGVENPYDRIGVSEIPLRTL